ncbi:hypothetical protein GE061_019133 [Apolygus lucorum]|uniref:Uncharacterized protein n=1 Tax=Apolygus lucorum TaxID=248454 RepID=A0A8S9XA70_APOLU|nr:hypothetical protein GE061_019133 [Apolygus lucorum]
MVVEATVIIAVIAWILSFVELVGRINGGGFFGSLSEDRRHGIRSYEETAVTRAINSTQAQVHPVIPRPPPTMRTSLMIVSALVLMAVFSGSDARYFKKINADYVTYVNAVDWGRGKRQSHPDQTVARIPQVAFGDPLGNEALPSGGGQIIDDTVPAPVEYLTPPAPDTPPQTAPGQLSPQQPPIQLPPPQQLPLQQPPPQQPPPLTDKWDLGFEAGEILVPPVNGDQQASQYDTLKLFTLLPTSSLPQGELLDSFGPAEQESAADSRTPFVDTYRPEYQQLNQEEEESISAIDNLVT